MATKAAPAAAGDAPVKKKGKTLIIAAIAGVLLLGGGGAAAYFFLAKQKDGGDEHAAEAKVEKKAEKKVPVFVTLDPFTVNLQDEDGTHYLQVGIVLEAADTATVDQIKVHMPVIRNRVLLLLSSKRADELLTLAGKQKLADEIAEESRKPLGLAANAKGVEGVYFASFVIQ
jgi:flagellar FliL protein